MKRPQTAKGRSPYAGPFRVVMILVHFNYLLSDGQKWNVHQLKRFLPLVTLPECDPGLGQPTQWSPNTQHSEAMEEWASHRHRPLLEPQAEGHEDRDVPPLMLESKDRDALMPDEPEAELPGPARVQVPDEPERQYLERVRKKMSFYTPWR